MTTVITPDTRMWPTVTGDIYTTDQGTYTMLAIAGHDHGPSLNIHPTLTRPGEYRLTLYTTRVSHTMIAGHPDIVRSVAETMLRGAARQAGIEIKP